MLEKIYNTPYGEIHYWVSASSKSRPWLIFLPGLTADHHLFDQQISGLNQKFNCFVWDAPAHGLSRPFDLKFSMDNIAEYLHDILTTEQIQTPILIGQSLGGYISQVYIALYPNTVSGFVSIDSCPVDRSYYTGMELWFMKHTKWMYLSIPWKWLIKWGCEGTAKTEYGRTLMKKTMEAYEKKEYCLLADHGYRILAQAVLNSRGCPISCPTLLLCGEKDAAGSARRYNRNWTKKEAHPLIWVPNAGHNANTDAAEFVNNKIESFGFSVYADR